MNLNIRAVEQNTYDAIVVGSGISGGWAAKELCEKGLKTIVLERGRNVEHVKDYTTAMKAPWEFEHRLGFTNEMKENFPIQSRCYAFDEATQQFWVNDKENPYNEIKPFNWLRGYQVGGRSLMWGRQCYRWSDVDFEANAKDGHGVDWPIRYRDIEPWYSYVEEFVGVSGQAEGLPQLPDGHFLPAMEMNCLEKHVAGRIKAHFNDRIMTIGRAAHLTKGLHGRGPCQYRNLCARGCPFTGYFSSNGATLPAAAKTGNLTLRPDAVVLEVLYDDKKQKATGVRILDTHTMQTIEYYANIIFLNASTLGTTQILLSSVSSRFPNGFGNDSEQVGHNLMDHHYGVGAWGSFDGFKDQYYSSGRRPNGIYIPRFRNISEATKRTDYVRGFGYQGGADRSRGTTWDGIGAAFKEAQTDLGDWSMGVGSWGEHLPYYENKATLNKDKKDKYGLPTLDIDCAFKENEMTMRKDMLESAKEMLEAAGLKNVGGYDDMPPPGHCIHEMGTARMGKDPKTSVLNGNNQLHAVKNVFITDGSCMSSSACQNPSITYMALTARACDFAVKEAKKGNI
ncbi:GMC family oxidoreductase [Chitinophaga pendula]|uniref:GMC oxidoreductase n=1 Tax=Chitinophaga TaxID=79328 RepID=UPI000BAE9CF4|nr:MULTISPECIES: GMC family oxidoreductase [Chitinophaga]ASZ13596.1 GMC family oxidoreductase [Chitinophaga sp. MD30]UCJ08781.1 GMC family oxidoreductase [Chitinophaga pendula]